MVDDVKSAPTLTEMLRRRAALSPAQQYFRLYDETVTYARLWEQSGRYAAGLARAGVTAGDKICLIYPTCAEFFYTFFGALRIGAVPVPLYPTLGVDTTLACVSMTPRGRPVLPEVYCRNARSSRVAGASGGAGASMSRSGGSSTMRTFGASAQLSSTPVRNQPMVATAIASESRKMAAVVSTPSVG